MESLKHGSRPIRPIDLSASNQNKPWSEGAATYDFAGSKRYRPNGSVHELYFKQRMRRAHPYIQTTIDIARTWEPVNKKRQPDDMTVRIEKTR